MKTSLCLSNLLQTSMSANLPHVSMGSVMTLSTCTAVGVSLALQVSTVKQVCTHSVNEVL